MAYTKTTWIDGSAPDISAQNLNKMETGIEDAHTDIADLAGTGRTTETVKGVSDALAAHNHDGTYEPVLNADQKRKMTYGTADPSGGSDGDFYFQYQ